MLLLFLFGIVCHFCRIAILIFVMCCYTCISCLASTSMRCVFSVWTSKTNFSCCYKNPQDDERMIGFEEVTTEIEPLAKTFSSFQWNRIDDTGTYECCSVCDETGRCNTVIRATNGTLGRCLFLPTLQAHIQQTHRAAKAIDWFSLVFSHHFQMTHPNALINTSFSVKKYQY